MPLSKQSSKADEIPIFDEACIFKRGKYWQFRMWLTKEKKYARLSLKTKNQDTAIEKAKQLYHELMAGQLAGRSYYSKTTKQGVEEYLQQRALDVNAGYIVKGRYNTVKIHLEHWLDYIGRDTKLKELEKTDCENYLHARTKTKKQVRVSQVTVANEQSSINALIKWLYKRKETYIEAFDIKPMKRIDRGDESLRRSIFDEDEIEDIKNVLHDYIAEAARNTDDEASCVKLITGYYLLISIITGLRRGEQLALRWSDIELMEKTVKRETKDKTKDKQEEKKQEEDEGEEEKQTFNLVKIVVRAETSKVRKTRKFAVEDLEYFDNLFKFQYARLTNKMKSSERQKHFGQMLLFSVNGVTAITARAIKHHFNRVVELAEIKNTDKRTLVPYSFRHNFITRMLNRGAGLVAVSEMCGTSVAQIERTYYHTTEAKMITNALPDYHYKDGVLVAR